jgi:FtsH-binding integral membrane protein
MSRPARFCGLGVGVGTVLCLVLMVALHLLRPDYNPWRKFVSEYLVGRFGYLGTVAVGILAATYLLLLAGLRLTVRPSGFRTAACALLGVMIISLCACAVFPIDVLPPDGRLPRFTQAAIIHIAASAALFVSLNGLLWTLPGAYLRDEKWGSFSRVTRLLAYLTLATFAGLILAPFYLRGMAQRTMGLPIFTWLLLTGWRLRQELPGALVKAALLLATIVTLLVFVAASVVRILSSFNSPRTHPCLYWGLVLLFLAIGTFSFWRGTVELFSYLRERKTKR